MRSERPVLAWLSISDNIGIRRMSPNSAKNDDVAALKPPQATLRLGRAGRKQAR